MQMKKRRAQDQSWAKISKLDLIGRKKLQKDCEGAAAREVGAEPGEWMFVGFLNAAENSVKTCHWIEKLLDCLYIQ